MRRFVRMGIVLVSTAGLLTGCFSKSMESTTQMPQVTAANEISAIARLTSIATAEAICQAESESYATLDELIEKRLLTDPSRGKLTNYVFDLRLTPTGFEATAVPQKYPISGKRSFYIDESRVMLAADKRGAPATASDPVYQ